MKPGDKLSNRYEIIRPLGEGGMANVYLAHDLYLDRDVSVKLLRLDLRDDPQTRRRFEREAMATTQLHDPHIVGIYDVGIDHGMQYLVMEYVKGTDLKAYISRHFPIPLPQVVDIMEQVLSAVEVAHAHGIIHRDLKPQNILIDDNKHIKITDFGIATATSQNSLTQTNTLLGSVHYLSPEQVRGSIATERSDIYSLGIILYELLTGKVPFEGENAVSIALKHSREEMPSIRRQNPDIPQALENVVIHATAKHPACRYQSAKEMAEDLSTALSPARKDEPPYTFDDGDDGETKVLDLAELEHKEQTQHQSTDKERPTKPSVWQRHKKLMIGSGIAAVILIGIGLGTYLNTEISVPDVRGMTTAQAKSQLRKAHVHVGRVKEQQSQSVAVGRVLTTSEPDSRVKRYQPVDLTISRGAKRWTIKQYVGQTATDVADELRSHGVKVVIKHRYSDNVDKGQIIAQSHKKGTVVNPARQSVTLTVSAGKPQFTVPNFKHDDISAVQSYANKHGLQLTTTERFSSTVPSNHVLKQIPKAGAKLSRGDTLTVIIASSGNQTKTTNIQINIPFDGNGGKHENRVQVYIADANHNLTMEYQDITINQETTINVPFTLRKGETGSYRVVRNGRTIMSATNITG
ncbi:MAG: Stk1 family PASTA domain-containing Ser/Thr kinase [[Lactobacillus] timonensis]|jgi:serine/threonine-protein kinase|nr:Stk1 family PASTA domain-containing Ser/Thr kinase [[Lactobacillus] timonensis]